MKDELSQELDSTRNFFFNAWKKHLAKEALEPLETQIVALIEAHPEYHDFFTHPEKNNILNPSDIFANPFLHISLHLSIHEQLSINQPQGIKESYHTLIQKHQDPHKAEHIMMQCLHEMMNKSWSAGEEPRAEDFLKYVLKYA